MIFKLFVLKPRRGESCGPRLSAFGRSICLFLHPSLHSILENVKERKFLRITTNTQTQR